MMTRITMALLLGALTLTPGLGATEESHSVEQMLVEMAKTPADHAALAKHYMAKAEDARAEARNHMAMGGAYGGTKVLEAQQKQQHCKKLAGQYEAIAKEYDALASLHAAEGAKKTP